MAREYFDNIRTVGASLDEGLAKLEEAWKMPHLLLCNNKKDYTSVSKKFLDNLKNELKTFKDKVDEEKLAMRSMRETYDEDLEKTKVLIQNLKEEVGDIKVLFLENGYVEETTIETDLSIKTDLLESFCVDEGDSFIKDCSYNKTESSINDSNSLLDSIHQRTPTSNIHLNSIRKKIYDQPPQEPVYSPCYYKVLKRK